MTRDQHVLKLWRRINKITLAVVHDQSRWTELWTRWNAVILKKFGPPVNLCRSCGNDGTKPVCGYLFCTGTL